MKKQKSLGNKGFSLVELIVVIAIMAILVGLLAPQFLKYVGQSKNSTDTSNNEILSTTANTTLSDVGVKVATGATVTITNGAAANDYATAVYAGFPAADTTFKVAFESAIGLDGATPKFPKTKGDDATGFKITITGSATTGYTAACEITVAP